jgi:hypothetical protein
MRLIGIKSTEYPQDSTVLWVLRAPGDKASLNEADRVWPHGPWFAVIAIQGFFILRLWNTTWQNYFFLQNPKWKRARRLPARNAKLLFRMCGLTFDMSRVVSTTADLLSEFNSNGFAIDRGNHGLRRNVHQPKFVRAAIRNFLQFLDGVFVACDCGFPN